MSLSNSDNNNSNNNNIAFTPRALRVLEYANALVLHDVSADIGRSALYDRNALVDAVNAAHQRISSSSSSSASSNKDRYLIFPYNSSPIEQSHPPQAPLHSVEAAAAFLGVLRLQSASYAVLVSHARRCADLPGEAVAHVVSKVRFIRISANDKAGAGAPASMQQMSKEDRELAAPLTKTLESGGLYITCACAKNDGRGAIASVHEDSAFWFTQKLAENSGKVAMSWAARTIYGFIGSATMRFASSRLDEGAAEFCIALVSRRSRRRAGTRYITRGVDAMGDVANFVETEQIVWRRQMGEHDHRAQEQIVARFVITRGSIPVFWRQNNGIARPSPELDGALCASRIAFKTHFESIAESYGKIVAVSLVDKSGSEGVLAEAFEKHFELDLKEFVPEKLKPKLVSFDFHRHCSGKEYERGLAALLSRVRDDVLLHGITVWSDQRGHLQKQNGVFRVNCVDCLDRTNVVQNIIARVVMRVQLDAVFERELSKDSDAPIRLYGDSEDRYKHLWGDNADAISKQYSGTGALKTDFTRTGKRSTTGVIGDGVKSVMRMYYKNFVDEARQEALDILTGNAVVRPLPRSQAASNDENTSSASLSKAVPNLMDGFEENVRASDASASSASATTSAISKNDNTETNGTRRSLSPSRTPLWYSFDLQRLNAGGDRQEVRVELRESSMTLASPEGVRIEYPRQNLMGWERLDDARAAERSSAAVTRQQPVRLRLIYKNDPKRRYATSAASASPLDLLFRGGVAARENFLRALLSWAAPPVASLLSPRPVRLRCISGTTALGVTTMKDWGLAVESKDDDGEFEIVALVMPETNSSCREWGLAAVPTDVDISKYVLISARAVADGGPAIAVLASRAVASTVMSVCESVSARTSSSSSSMTAGGISSVAAGVSGNSGAIGSGGGEMIAHGRGVAVALEVAGTSVCFASVNVNGAQDLFRVISSLRMRKSVFDISNQFHHLCVAGLMGDLRWHRDGVSRDGPSARKWVRLGDGSLCYSLSNGLAVMRNSFPTLTWNDALNENSWWREISSASDVSRKAKLTATLMDGVTSGRTAPRIPIDLVQYVATITDLCGKDIKMPPGVDVNTPLNTYVNFYSDYASSDATSTRPTQRPTSSPEWKDPYRIVFIPSDADEIENSFILGQVLIPTPLSDAVSAGHFVIPLSNIGKSGAKFDVPCRLAGISTGRIQGFLHLMTLNDVGDDRIFGNTQQTAMSGVNISRSNSVLENGNSQSASPDFAASLGSTPSSGAVMDIAQSKSSSNPYAGFVPTSLPRNASEMNEKLEAARKKGTKQLKNAMSKLSAFMGQPMPNSQRPRSSRAAYDSFAVTRPASYGAQATISSGSATLDGFATGNRPASTGRLDTTATVVSPMKATNSSQGKDSTTSLNQSNADSKQGHLGDFTDFFTAAPPGAGIGKPPSRAQAHVRGSLGDDPTTSHETPRQQSSQNHYVADDPLLQSLSRLEPRASKNYSGIPSKDSKQRRPKSSSASPPPHAHLAEDALLTGLAQSAQRHVSNQSNAATVPQEDAWGSFTSAQMELPNAKPREQSRRSDTLGEKPLIEF